MKVGFLDIIFLKKAGVIFIPILFLPLLPLGIFCSVLFTFLVKMFVFLGKIQILQNFKKFHQRIKVLKCLPVAKALTPYFLVNFILY